MLADLYYEPRAPSAFSTYEKLKRAAKTKSASHIKTWLQKQDAYTLHRQVRKRFPRNPYSVNNILDILSVISWTSKISASIMTVKNIS